MADLRQPDINTLFENLDKWRHFAGYPLEPRVDALFGLFLPHVLEKYLSVADMHEQVIPQFPLKKQGDCRSDKVDFFSISRDKARAVLVEIKTDMDSLRDPQIEYLDKAAKRGMSGILCDLKLIVAASRGNSRTKYFHLLRELERMDMLKLPPKLGEKIREGKPKGTTKLIHEIRVCVPPDSNVEVVYIQPEADCSTGQGNSCLISFSDFADLIRDRGNLGSTFASYLIEWEKGPAQSTPFQDATG